MQSLLPSRCPGRRQGILRSALLLVLAVSCTTVRMKVQEPFVPGLFEDPLVDTTLGRDPDLRRRYESAFASLRSGEPDRALAGFDQLSSVAAIEAPDRYPIFVGQAAVYLAANDRQRAGQAIGRTLALRPDYPAGLLASSILAHLEGDDRKALEVLDRLRDVQPRHEGAARLRSRVVARVLADALEATRQAELRGDSAGALREIRLAGQLDPGSVAFKRKEGALALATGDAEAAVEAYTAAAILDGTDPDTWLGLGEAYMRSGKTQSARDAFERASGLPGGQERARRMVATLRESERMDGETSPQLARSLATSSIDRAGLAALLAARLPSLERVQPRTGPAIITDVTGSWARQQIQEMVALGVLEVYENHTFRPESKVTRVMLAQVGAAVLRSYRAMGRLSERPPLAANPIDVPSEHIAHDSVALTLRYGLMETDAAGEFGPFSTVSGAEAERLVRALEELGR